MKHIPSPFRRWHACLAKAALASSLALLGVGAAAVENGPDPSSSFLNASSGPYRVSTDNVSSFSARGFGGGTIYYPTTSGQYGVIAVSPGYTASQSSIAWLGRRMATHGFVVITIDTITTLDQPASRATQLLAALDHVVNRSSSTVRSRVDSSRQAVAGHSMGGGGSLIAAEDNPWLKAAYPMTPWSISKNFSRNRVPTMIIGADGDTIANVYTHARPFYDSLPSSTAKAYGELNGGSHFSPNFTNTPIGRYAVSWMKRFVDGDTRYSPYLCGAPHDAYATRFVFDRYQENCDY
ncbi:alpha/beta hydrolase [Hydrogenophaga sp. 5NK40-0174]|uniref:alpha/beta hydrolase family protein n=1 Tax=Hydrogenophaga sp. 5NK40-0174 TaxID=3127649 RepID=UPI00310699F6